MYDYTSSYGSSDENSSSYMQSGSGDYNEMESSNKAMESDSNIMEGGNNKQASQNQSSGENSTENKMQQDNLMVLNEIYQISTMGKQAISSIIPKVDDENFKKELMKNYENYEDICSKSTSEIMKMGEKPREKNPLSKVMLWGSVNVTSLVDSSPSSLSNMIIKGSHNGISNMTRTLNQHSGNIDENVKNLADSYMKKEESNIDSMQKFL